MTLELYAADTANGHKVAIVLEELGLDYRIHLLNLMAGEHMEAEYKKLNPVGKIPLLIAGDEHIYGSLAIVMALCQQHQKLLPSDGLGAFYECLALVATDLAPALSGQFMFANIIADRPPSAVRYFESEIHRYLRQLETYAQRANFLAGDKFTLVDAMAYPNVAVSALRLVEQSEFDQTYPGLAQWRDRVAERPAVTKAISVCSGGS